MSAHKVATAPSPSCVGGVRQEGHDGEGAVATWSGHDGEGAVATLTVDFLLCNIVKK